MVVKYISSWNAKWLRYTCRVGQIDLAVDESAKIRKSLKYGIVEERTRGYAQGRIQRLLSVSAEMLEYV